MLDSRSLIRAKAGSTRRRGQEDLATRRIRHIPIVQFIPTGTRMRGVPVLGSNVKNHAWSHEAQSGPWTWGFGLSTDVAVLGTILRRWWDLLF